MNKKIYNEVNRVFGTIKTIYVAQMVAISLTMKVKNKDMTAGGTFTERIKKKAREKILWRLSTEEFDEVCKIWGCLYDYDVSLSIPEDLGGHKFKTLLQIYNEKG